jgi:hypothetical protein
MEDEPEDSRNVTLFWELFINEVVENVSDWEINRCDPAGAVLTWPICRMSSGRRFANSTSRNQLIVLLKNLEVHKRAPLKTSRFNC